MERRRRRGGSLTDLRRANREHALRLLRLNGGMTQAELARRSGLSHASVSNIVRELIEEGTASMATVTQNGRRATHVVLNPHAELVAGVDFGNRHLRVALADMLHTVVAEDYIRLQQSHRAAEGVERCVAMVGRLAESAGRDIGELKAMAVGLPGPIVHATSEVGSPTILPGWADVDIAGAFRAVLDVPVVVENDANLGAAAESLWGRGRGVRDFAYLKLSTGIGAGLVLNGRLYRGASGTAGEIGHTTIAEDGALCRCGNRGCLETVAAAPALLEQLRLTHGDALTLEDLLRLSDDGDIGCRRIITDAGRHIGVAVANLCNVVNPELIIVGGELAMAGDVLLSAIEDGLSRRAIPVAARAAQLVAGALAGRTAVLGAVAIALQETETGATEHPSDIESDAAAAAS